MDAHFLHIFHAISLTSHEKRDWISLIKRKIGSEAVVHDKFCVFEIYIECTGFFHLIRCMGLFL